MIVVRSNLTIELVQGDTGGIEFSLSCIELSSNDRACLIVTDELNNKIFSIHSIIDKGIAYFKFSKEHTSLTEGNYKYHIKCTNSENGIDATFVCNQKFVVRKGFECA